MNQLQTTEISTFTLSSDGVLIERIGAAQLVRRLNSHIEIAVEFASGGTRYRAAQLPQSLERASNCLRRWPKWTTRSYSRR